ncbi:MAG: gliding motility-associated C-terminal domain-containing protein [Flavobacteriales bacterium]
MIRSKLFILFLLCIAVGGQAQSPADWWYFGYNAGMHFTGSGPSSVAGGQITTFEGCAGISDQAGNLLFYTDGSTVYNKNHAVMTNGTGLLGNSSSTNSGIIVPKPSTPNQYYVISQSTGTSTGMTYSLIDMTLSSGLGSVTGTKNLPISNLTRENVTSVKHANGVDFWIVTHYANSNSFASFLITSAGVNTTPVVSVTNQVVTAQFGAIKISPDGSLVCYCSQSGNNFTLGQFDNTTGVISNAFTRTVSGYSPYGVEFSPNSKVMYIAPRSTSGTVRQFDINLFDSTTIINSEYTAASSVPTGALQLGPDEKIYVATYNNAYVHAINSPNTLGSGCGFTSAAVTLSSGTCRQGLPNFSPSWFAPGTQITKFCFNAPTEFSVDTTEVDTVYWNYGDPASGALNIGGGFETQHTYTDTGMFLATCYFLSVGDTSWDSSTHDVHIFPRQTATVSNDTTICNGDTAIISVVPQDYSTYLWSNTATTTSIGATTTGNYIVTVFGVCDTVMDTAFVTVDQPFTVNLGPNQSICDYDTATLNTGLGNSLTFQWSNNAYTPSIQVTAAGTYSVTVTNGTCTYSDDIVVSVFPHLSVNLGNDSSFCYVNSAILTPQVLNASGYVWSNGTTNNVYTATQTGQVKVTVTDGHGCFKNDSVFWTFYYDPIANLGNDTLFCRGDEVLLNPHLGPTINYLWSTGETSPTIRVSDIALYWVEVSDEHCTMRDSIVVDRYPDLEMSLGNDINTCIGKQEPLSIVSANDILTSYFWSNGSTDSAIIVTEPGHYTVTVSNGLCYTSDDVNVLYFEYPVVDLGPDTNYCFNTELEFDVTTWKPVNYRWHDGTSEPKNYVKVTKEKTVWVSATNVVCTTVDSLHLNVHPAPKFDLADKVMLCEDSAKTVLARGDSAYKYTWSTGSKGTSIVVSEPGIYSLNSSDGLCDYVDTVHVIRAYRPHFELGFAEEICDGESMVIESNLGMDTINFMKWSTGSTIDEITIYEPGTYWLEARNGCGWGSDTAKIILCGCFVRLPNAFHPDGNIHNETFGPVYDCELTEYELTIYDRWGRLMFETKDLDAQWDGKNLGKDVPIGAYVWKMKYAFMNHDVIEERAETGTVTIFR